jgi:hypothetical protein
MNRECDGGGNRYLSDVVISGNKALERFFGTGKEKVCSGVCSLQMREDDAPWIVCPRRLLALGRDSAERRAHQRQVEDKVLSLCGYESGTRLGIWPEVKLKYVEKINGVEKAFDYTFDYILMPLGVSSQEEIENSTGEKWGFLKPHFEREGYTIAKRGNAYFVDDAPVGIPAVIEIMTSSTSGGNKTKRTTIPMAFEDAILGREHSAPGINYRQVWARMVSQLIVKSEVGIAWGGKTIWIVQDVLVKYISATTALDVYKFLSEITSEVNLLSFSYAESFRKPKDVIDLVEGKLYSGPISAAPKDGKTKPSFEDMVRSPVCPPLKKLINLLVRRRPASYIVVP